MEKLRDRLLFKCGTDEPWFMDEAGSVIAAHWRKPLRIDEINRLSQTADVRRREGRS